MRWSLARWNEAIANDFAARMDRCVLPPEKVNHPPVAVVDGDGTTQILRRTISPGAALQLAAAGTSDPDGNTVEYQWSQYAEAGSLPTRIALENAASADVRLVAPRVVRPGTIHLVLAVTDGGSPRLTTYRRIIVTVEP